MAQYGGILLRQNLDDKGLMPRTGGWTASPDIIAAGTQPVHDPQAYFGSDTSYASDPTQEVVKEAPNYIYVRGKNVIGGDPQTGTARVFAARQSLFLYPSQWLENPLTTSRGETVSEIASVAANTVGVTIDPFVWVPKEVSEHYCLVGFISTPDYPFEKQKPSNAVTSLNDLAAWIGANGGTGWHNVQFASGQAATFTNSTTYPASSTPAKIQFAITCISCPVGSQVSFSCGTPLPDGTYINLPPTTITKPSQIGFVVDYDVPAGWTSPIYYSYYANGNPPVDSNFSVSMSASIKSSTPGSEVFAAYVQPAHEVFPDHIAFAPGGLRLTALTDMPVDYLIPVGSDMTKLR
ncbi:hypothetical protein [Ancylobacter lacus]|uniref:hypothetical protein n=1 Tax=Ancylobacter lacus TaxID=2579970 RepID=UPI001BD0A92F|nr:hypothetical protein [Ancylobacter lacus]MBS7539527.1 hypothetical protein [Ancylobacter lacus]